MGDSIELMIFLHRFLADTGEKWRKTPEMIEFRCSINEGLKCFGVELVTGSFFMAFPRFTSVLSCASVCVCVSVCVCLCVCLCVCDSLIYPRLTHSLAPPPAKQLLHPPPIPLPGCFMGDAGWEEAWRLSCPDSRRSPADGFPVRMLR